MLRYTLADGFELSVHPTRTESSFYASKYGCRFMQSTYEISIEIPFGQLGQKFMQEKIIDHFGPLDQR